MNLFLNKNEIIATVTAINTLLEENRKRFTYQHRPSAINSTVDKLNKMNVFTTFTTEELCVMGAALSEMLSYADIYNMYIEDAESAYQKIYNLLPNDGIFNN